MHYILACIFCVLFLFSFTAFSHAYIDPNAGGFFFQTIAPIIYGILGVIVVFWKRITGFIGGKINRSKKPDSTKRNGQV